MRADAAGAALRAPSSTSGRESDVLDADPGPHDARLGSVEWVSPHLPPPMRLALDKMAAAAQAQGRATSVLVLSPAASDGNASAEPGATQAWLLEYEDALRPTSRAALEQLRQVAGWQ